MTLNSYFPTTVVCAMIKVRQTDSGQCNDQDVDSCVCVCVCVSVSVCVSDREESMVSM